MEAEVFLRMHLTCSLIFIHSFIPFL